MSYYSALIANTQNGSSILRLNLTGAGVNPANPNAGGLSSYTRVSPIVAPHFTIQDPGGFVAADFIVPADIAGNLLAHLRFDAWCWIYDGRTPVFYGKIDAQPRPDANGDVLVSVTGFWGLLHTTRFREAWDDPDLSKWVPCDLNDHSPFVDLTSSGRLRIGWPGGTVIANGNRAQVDYLLFNEEAGTRDSKAINAWEISCTNDVALGAASLNFRVYGRSAVDSGSEDQLVSRSTVTGTFDISQGQVANSWPSGAGYRIIRLGLQGVSAATLGTADRFMIFDRIRVGTQEALLTTFGSPPASSSLAANIFDPDRQTFIPDYFDVPAEFSHGDGVYTPNVPLTAYGTDPVNRSVVASGVGVDSMTFSEWVSPAEALSALTTIDGFQCGFYYPAAPQTGWWDASDLPWPQQMPQLSYQPWSALSAPDYQVMIRRGADVVPDESPQPLISLLYVNYEKHAGRQFSMVVQDADTSNYLFANGIQRAEDYTIDTPVSDNVATNMAAQVFTLRRQPLAAGQVTVWANRPGSITTGTGSMLPRLSQLRPGVVQLSDLPRTAYKTGRCTQIEWWGETLDTPEHATLTLEHPGSVSLPRRLGAAGVLAQRTVRVRGGQRKRR